MATRADLGFLGAPIDDPVGTARFISGMILTPRQKAAALRDYLVESNIVPDSAIREAAQDFVEFF